MISAIYCKLFFKSKVIIDWDDWDEIWKFKLYLIPLICLSLILLRAVDKIIVVNKNLIEYGMKFANRSKFVYVPNGVDLEEFNPRRVKSEIKKKYKTKGKKIILYIGSLNNNEVINREIEIFKDKKIHNAILMIVGYGKATRYIENKVKKYNNILFFKNINKKDIPKYIKAADICIVPLENNFSAKVRSPVKLKEYIAMEKCVLGTGIGELKEIYNGKGNLFRSDNLDEVEKIREFLSSKEKKKKIEEYNTTIKKKFSYKRLSLIIKRVIIQLNNS